VCCLLAVVPVVAARIYTRVQESRAHAYVAGRTDVTPGELTGFVAPAL